MNSTRILTSTGLAFCFAAAACAYERLQGPTELLFHDAVNPPDAGYRRLTYDKDTHNPPRQISNQVVWSFAAVNSHGFFSHIGSSAQGIDVYRQRPAGDRPPGGKVGKGEGKAQSK